MPVNTGFYWSLGKIFNEIFNDFSSRSLSGTGTSRTRPLHGCETFPAPISSQNENAGYDATLSQIQTRRGHVLCLRQCLLDLPPLSFANRAPALFVWRFVLATAVAKT